MSLQILEKSFSTSDLNSASHKTTSYPKSSPKNTIKLRYSCEAQHKTQIVAQQPQQTDNQRNFKESTTKLCNCRDKPSCPLQGKCLEKSQAASLTLKNQKDLDRQRNIAQERSQWSKLEQEYKKVPRHIMRREVLSSKSSVSQTPTGTES
ncbi:hypothetical protein ElyMa_004304000 [Elysia marginata]|uniref:Uncharacterized protein n=1 Tax=Elysia marginata TaxID=1093978 RepID=A0AAV4GZA1_9GAST|nr:hypothetical protein ElyMa_004304000 [Elysia marginata]